MSAVKTDETEKISTAGRTFTLVKQKMPAIAAKTVSSESARLQDLQSAGMDVLKPHLQHQSLGFKESPCPLLYYVSWWQPWSERPPVSNQHESGESQLRSHAKRLAVELRRLRSRAASAVAADGAPSAQSSSSTSDPVSGGYSLFPESTNTEMTTCLSKGSDSSAPLDHSHLRVTALSLRSLVT